MIKNGKQLVFLKHQLNLDIQELLSKFTDETGLYVKSVKVVIKDETGCGDYWYSYPQTELEFEPFYYEGKPLYTE